MTQPLNPCPGAIDKSFGPWAGVACRGGFDFTLFFEEIILSIPLQCFFLVGMSWRLWQLTREDAKVAYNFQRPLKVIASVCLLALSAALLALWTTANKDAVIKTPATIPTAALVFLSSLGFVLLSWMEHGRTIRPSFWLTMYLFFSTLLDLPRTRTLWMTSSSRAVPIVFTCTMALRFVMLIIESTEKRGILLPKYKWASRGMTSSTISRSCFFWLTPLFMTGYRRNLTLEDLDPLDPQLESEPLYKALSKEWDNTPNRTAPGALFMTWIRAFTGPALVPVIPRLFQIAFTYTQPFLINQGIALAATPETQPFNNWGYGLIGAYAIVYTGIAVSTGQYQWTVFRTTTMMRGSIVGLIYQKSLRLDLNCQDVSPDGALTLMTTDTETVMHGMFMFHEIWGSLVEIAIGIYLLYRQLGSASAMPVGVSFFVLILMGFLAVYIGPAQAAWIQASQERVTTTAKTLGNVKWLKISGLNDVAFSIIRSLRIKELKISTRFRMLLGASLMLVVCVPLWAPVLTFCVYAAVAAKGGTGSLTISKAFTSLSLFHLVMGPLASIINSIPQLATSFTSMGRIQTFLNGKERQDNRMTMNDRQEVKGVEDPDVSSAHDLSDSIAEDDSSITAGNEVVPITDDKKASAEILGSSDMIASISGKFSWNEDSEPVINISSWDIQRRDFTLVLGPVGCGKSTLLKALLGELSSFKGFIRTAYSAVSYCDQTPWLPNEAVRNIIIGPSHFDEPWYETVTKACALDTDMRTWPNGDATLVGTKGISMSGGQKHRLSIARALYSRKELIVMDDVFSGLDAAIEDIVFHNLFGKDGLLRTANLSVVVASSDVRRVPYADKVVLLDKNGTIKGTGTPKEIEHTIGTFAADTDWTTGGNDGPTDLTKAATRQADTTIAAMETQVDSTRRLGDVAMYGFYARSAGWDTLVTLFAALAAFAFFTSFPNFWLKWWAKDNEAHPNQNLGKWLGGYAGFAIGATVTILLATWQLLIVIINRSGRYFHDSLLKTTSRASMAFHSTVDSGTTVNRFSQDLMLIDMELPGVALGVAIGLTFSVADFLMISISSKYMAAVLPFLIVVFYPIQHVYLRTSRQMRLLDIEYKAPLFSQLIGTLDGLATIRAFQWQDELAKKNIRRLDESQRPSYLLYCLQRWLTFTIDMTIAVIAVVVIVLTTTLREQIGPGNMGIALSNILAFSGTLQTTVTSWVMMEIALGAVARVHNFIADTKPEDDFEEYDDIKSQTWPSKGAIELQGVTASYFTSEPVLRDISLKVNPGQRVAVCGRTGSGKSSLALCLLRMMRQESGTITIDGVDISTLPLEYVRSSLAALPQEPYIFDGTIRLNLDPAKTVPDEELIAALKRVRLWDKIEQRGGLDETMNSKFLSQGETQLFVFARAMLRKSKVLILDEFSSSLDDETSEIIYDVLRTWFRGWTIIAIAHKLQWILDFDKVAVLDAGRLVEYDEPKRLLEQDSIFKKLYELSSPKVGFVGSDKASADRIAEEEKDASS